MIPFFFFSFDKTFYCASKNRLQSAHKRSGGGKEKRGECGLDVRENFIVHFVKISLFFSLSIFPAFFILFFVLSFVLVVVR